MKKKMEAAGVLAGTDPPEWRLIWRVEEIKRAWKIAVHVQSLRDDALWGGMAVYHHGGVSLDDLVADSVTWEVILQASWGIMELLEARGGSASAGGDPDAPGE